MPTIAVIDTKGAEVKQVELNPRIFEAKVNETLIAQSIRTRMHNAWLGTHKTKSRAEVSGGGRKPWRQKGTGRARHGSTRSPIWVGGGHAHPLRPIDHSLKMPQKMRRAALFAALTDQFNQDGIRVLAAWDVKKVQTKEAVNTLKTLNLTGKVMIVVAEKNVALEQSLSNIKNVSIKEARLLHPYDVLHNDTVVFIEDSLSKMEETFLK